MSLNLTYLFSRLRDVALLLFWLALIFWLSDQSVLVEIADPGEEKVFYKSAHMAAYGLMLWLWWRVLTPQRRATWPILMIAFTLTVLYGMSDEIHQRFVPGRHGRVADVLFDTAGALMMVLLLRQLTWLRHFPENIFNPRLKETPVSVSPTTLEGENL